MNEREQYNTPLLLTIARNIRYKRWIFARSFFTVFIISFFLLYGVGVTPQKQENIVTENTAVDIVHASSTQPAIQLESHIVQSHSMDVVPLRIVIESVGIDAVILNPQSRDIAVLDDALLSGVVRYPGSGLLNDESNMFLFGHSSYLRTVHDQNFKAFNDLQKVEKGDMVRVESTDTVNVYKVETIRLIDADEALVELSHREKKLTLSTCNSFGAPGERYIVEASFVESHTL